MTRFWKLSPIWHNFKRLWTFLKLYFVFCKKLNMLLQVFVTAFGQSFTVVIGKRLKNNLAIWSHWQLCWLEPSRKPYTTQHCSLIRNGFYVQCFTRVHIYIDLLTVFLKNEPTPASFCLFSFFSNTNFTENTLDIRGIRTRIIGVEGEHADHLTTTTVQFC